MYREKLAMMKNTYRTIYGAIAGDIIGSMYEFRSVKSKDFELFPYGACFTDEQTYIKLIREIGDNSA